jgi:SPP1 family phage portal protein
MRRYRAILKEGILTNEQIKQLISLREEEKADLLKLQRYYLGDNPGIIDKVVTIGQNQIPVPYGRLLVKIVIGFMYKAGLISYSVADEANNEDAYFEALEDVFQANREAELNTELGKDQTIFGEAYELHYIDNDEAVDQFAKVSVFDFIPVYNYDIKPKLIAGIRYFKTAETQYQQYQVEVYYAKTIEYFELRGGTLNPLETKSHPYGQVPVVIYRNNEDLKGDLEHIQKLIDAYDVLISTFLDDEEKFAEAILLIYGKYLDDETVEKLKKLRVIDNLRENDRLEYLTKDLSTSGRKELLDIIRQEIHRQSLIPDMVDTSVLGQKSGEAFIYLFALFELLAGEKQSYFAQGIKKRIELITAVMSYPRGTSAGNPNDIKINFTRNLPKNLVMYADMVSKLWGMVSKKTLLSQLPFIDNAETELDQINDEDDSDPGKQMTADDVLKIYNQKDQTA